MTVIGLIFLVLALAAFALSAGMAPFEFTFLLLLVIPIFAHLLGTLLGAIPASLYIILVLGGALLMVFLAKGRAPKITIPEIRSPAAAGAVPVLLFCVALFVFFRMSLLWPDFIAIGERLRDYALLASAINSPLSAREPWMAGYPLNYYLYWFRFGHFLSSFFRLEVWETYHLMAAFSFAFYLANIFNLLYRYLHFSFHKALFLAILIVLGSNVSGMVFFLEQDSNWWGPSRVIQGAINEFPAWSFLLGDLHPHYLNLGLIPFFVCLGLYVTKGASRSGDLLLLTVGLIPGATLWLYNSNAWDVPMWWAVIVAFTLILARCKIAASSGVWPAVKGSFVALPAFGRSICNVRFFNILLFEIAALLSQERSDR